jgi:hypothetical protein
MGLYIFSVILSISMNKLPIVKYLGTIYLFFKEILWAVFYDVLRFLKNIFHNFHRTSCQKSVAVDMG